MKQVPCDSILDSYRFILLARLSTLVDQYHNWESLEHLLNSDFNLFTLHKWLPTINISSIYNSIKIKRAITKAPHINTTIILALPIANPKNVESNCLYHYIGDCFNPYRNLFNLQNSRPSPLLLNPYGCSM